MRSGITPLKQESGGGISPHEHRLFRWLCCIGNPGNLDAQHDGCTLDAFLLLPRLRHSHAHCLPTLGGPVGEKAYLQTIEASLNGKVALITGGSPSQLTSGENEMIVPS